MKQTLLTVVLLFTFYFSGHAQISKGTWMLGGSFNVSSRNTDLSTNTPYQGIDDYVAPKAGIFVSERWVVGIEPSFNISQHENDSYTYKTNSVYLSPFVRYYKPVGEKLSFFAELDGISYGIGNRTLSYKDSPNRDEKNRFKSYSLGVFIRPGITYFITPKIGIETSIGSLGYGYTYSQSKQTSGNVTTPGQKDKETTRSGGLSLNSGFNLGIQFYL